MDENFNADVARSLSLEKQIKKEEILLIIEDSAERGSRLFVFIDRIPSDQQIIDLANLGFSITKAKGPMHEPIVIVSW